MHPQLTLALDTAPLTSFGSFHVSEANAVARRSVAALVDGSSADQQVYVWGPLGCGKSHLLSAACQAVSAQGYRIAYLTGELASQSEALSGLEQCELVCIDDLHDLESASEIDLCQCIERCRAAGTMLLFAADRPPEELGGPVRPELAALLDLGPRFRVAALEGEALREALRAEAARRSLPLGDDVLDYLLKRFEPSMAALRPVIDLLGDVSLSEQRRLSVSLVKSVFDRRVGGGGAEGEGSGDDPAAGSASSASPTLRPV